MIGYNDNVVPWLTFLVGILLLSNVAFAMGMALSNVIFDTATALKVQPMILVLLKYALYSNSSPLNLFALSCLSCFSLVSS